MSEISAGLPVPTKEKVTKWVVHAGVAALAVTGVITFMPYVNRALSLLVDGFFSAIQLGLLAAGACAVVFAAMTLWPLYKRLIESFSSKATWALFEYDPITPMMMWLEEVHKDRAELEKQYKEVGAVIAQNSQMVSDNLTAAAEAEKKFAFAVSKYGPNSSQAQLMSLEPGALRESAERIRQSTEPLVIIKDTLQEVVEATAFTERKAELDVSALQQEFKAGISVERATSAATRVLKGRSQRKADAMLSMKIIHDKYAGSFGRLQALRELSRDVITSVDMSKGTYHQEALERLRSESRLITGTSSTTPAQQQPSISFYSVPKITGK